MAIASPAICMLANSLLHFFCLILCNFQDPPSLDEISRNWTESKAVRPTRVKIQFEIPADEKSWREVLIDGDCGIDNSRHREGRKIIGWNEHYWFELTTELGNPSKWTLANLGRQPMPEKILTHRDQ